MDDDLALLDRWCAGDEPAGNQLFKRHFQSVYRFFEHKVDGDIDELVQETFLACVKGRERFRRQSSFRTYVFAIARHVLYHHWRDRAGAGKHMDVDEVSIASLSTSAGSRMARSEEHAHLLAALRDLPVEQQVLLELFYWEDMDGDQLAEVFDVAEATTRGRLFRARQALRERLATVADLDAWARGLRDKSG